MPKNFWTKLKKPIFALAPMANVTDAATRLMLAKYGKSDVMWTEFVSCDGLCSAGKEAILIDLKYDKKERPIVAQIFGSKPENFYKTAIMLREMGFDGIDINMGCPDKNVIKQGAGAALMQKPKLAAEIVAATKKGADKLPVSIKTRLGYSKDILEEWLPCLLATEPTAITIHCRTKKEMSLVPAHWDRIADAVKIRDQFCPGKEKILILGNGDVVSRADGLEKIKQSGADGCMVGRGIFGNPWFFGKRRHIEKIPLAERLQAMVEHTYLFEKFFTGIKPFDIMKKHYKAYVTGFPRAKELRVKLMEEAKDAKTVENIIKNYLK